MLSSAKISTSSWRYYQNQVARGACEYYLDATEAPGRWHGRGLRELGLTAGSEVAERQLEAVFGRALHPVTGRPLGRAWRVDGVTGFDLTLSAPKSVSALWALGNDGIKQRHWECARGRGQRDPELSGCACRGFPPRPRRCRTGRLCWVRGRGV
jgi:hypothetical protein